MIAFFYLSQDIMLACDTTHTCQMTTNIVFELVTVEPRHETNSAFCLACENKGADQLCSYCFRYTDSYINIPPKSGILS